MNKKVKLLKDIPGFKTGTIFRKSSTGEYYPEGDNVTYTYLKDMFESPSLLDIGWFEEVKEVPATFDVWYIRSTGEIIGPNKVITLGHKLQLRRDFGNLFYSKEEAEKAQKIMKQFLDLYNESSHYPYLKIHIEGLSCEL